MCKLIFCKYLAQRYKGKGKGFPCIQDTEAQRVSRGIALPFRDLGAEMGVGGQHHAPAALPPRKARYPLYRRLGRPQGRYGRVRKISPLPEFDPRTVQRVASCYTDWAIPAQHNGMTSTKIKCRRYNSVDFENLFLLVVTFYFNFYILRR